jgi:2-polyprenyl-3-methyl-5-hydroxy-6-metoxy-1,4-benzoquinol methylase
VIKDNSDSSWKKWGDRDPYYGVLASDEFKLNTITPAARAAFFDSGQTHVSRVLSVATNYYGQFGRKNALDFGCGAGRLVVALAGQFDSVTGVDVSPGMLSAAAGDCTARAITNVEFQLSDDQLSLVRGKFDFVHSFLVFQHIPRVRGEVILARLLHHLEPGGIVAVHVPFARHDSRAKQALHALRKGFVPANIVVNLLKRRNWDHPFMQMNMYDMNRLLRVFSDNGLTDVFVEVADVGDFVSAFVFGKMPIRMRESRAGAQHIWSSPTFSALERQQEQRPF